VLADVGLPPPMRKLIAGLEAEGFELVSDRYVPESFGYLEIHYRQSPVDIWIRRDRLLWEIGIQSDELKRHSIDAWKACIEKKEVRIEPPEVEWGPRFVLENLDAIRNALALANVASTRECLEKKEQERNRLVGLVPDIVPFSLDCEPRSGVKVHFGFRWREGFSFILPAITIQNGSSLPFQFDASDFRLFVNGKAQESTRGWNPASGVVEPGETRAIEGNADWYWRNKRRLNSIKLMYLPSDPSSVRSARSAVWIPPREVE
jgi:hypothetical protein